MKQAIKALQDPLIQPEQSYLNGILTRYGTSGSVRLDVISGNVDGPEAIYDLKTSGATLARRRLEKIRHHLPEDSKAVPIIELKP